jgi:hypothetical protein
LVLPQSLGFAGDSDCGSELFGGHGELHIPDRESIGDPARPQAKYS